jgi:uncharacterized protein
VLPNEEAAWLVGAGRPKHGAILLVKFTVTNFRSICRAQSLTLTASSDIAHVSSQCVITDYRARPKLNRSALIFGPNGSGKSNLLAAINVMREFVVNSHARRQGELADHYAPFPSNGGAQKPTEFYIEVLLDKICYQYGFSYDARHVCTEGLRVSAGGKSQRWFERSAGDDSTAETWEKFSQLFKDPHSGWRNSTRPHMLYLSVVSENSPQLTPLIRWFERCVHLNPDRPRSLPELADIRLDADAKREVLTFLQQAGLKIVDLRRTNHAGGPASGTGFEFAHTQRGGPLVWLPMEEECSGLTRLMALYIPFLKARSNNGLLIADEFDRGLHPLLACHVLRIMNSANKVGGGAQLILSTHNTTLMDTQLLRRDQMWLMGAGENMQSEVRRISLPANPVRARERVGAQYLSGKYGGVPHIQG